MGKFVGVSVVLFVLAVAFVVMTQGPEMAALIAAFRSEPLLHKIAWAVIVLVPLVMLPFAVWLWDRLLRQHQAGTRCEDRLDGVRRDVKDLTKSAGQHRSGRETTYAHRSRRCHRGAAARLSEAERFAQIQQSRNEIDRSGTARRRAPRAAARD